jgi:hypothetical protein
LVYDGQEDPTTKSFFTTTDTTGNALEVGSYQFRVISRNVVGWGSLSDYLTVTVSVETSAENSFVSGDGIAAVSGAVTTQVIVNAFDEDNVASLSSTDIFFLRVEQLCKVTDNYRCDLS